MSRNLVPKFILIFVLMVLAVAALYPPSKTLKPGIDLAGGTSLIYAINTEGLSGRSGAGPGPEDDYGPAPAYRPGQYPEPRLAPLGQHAVRDSDASGQQGDRRTSGMNSRRRWIVCSPRTSTPRRSCAP